MITGRGSGLNGEETRLGVINTVMRFPGVTVIGHDEALNALRLQKVDTLRGDRRRGDGVIGEPHRTNRRERRKRRLQCCVTGVEFGDKSLVEAGCSRCERINRSIRQRKNFSSNC